MNSDERYFPKLRPLKSLADDYEYLTNSQSFNMAIRLQGKGVIHELSRGRDIFTFL